MTSIALTPTQIVLIIISGLIIIGLIVLLIHIAFTNYLLKKNIVRVYFKTVNKVALYHDYYLINNLKLRYDNNNTFFTYHHILFADKYIYVIKDVYYKGELVGERADASWRLIRKKDNKEEIVDNPILENEKLVDRLSSRTQIDRDVFISVVLVNDECNILNLDNTVSNSYIINRSDFHNLIKAIESRDISPFNKAQLATIVSDIDKLNARKKPKRKKHK
jgi:hypothetical protein